MVLSAAFTDEGVVTAGMLGMGTQDSVWRETSQLPSPLLILPLLAIPAGHPTVVHVHLFPECGLLCCNDSSVQVEELPAIQLWPD